MINKLYEKFFNIIKDYYKIIIFYVFIFCLFTINLPYYISAPGGLIDTSRKIKTSDNFKLSGSFNMAYVSEFKATIPTYLWSVISPDWDLESEKNVTAGSESIKDMEYRNKMLLIESNKIAQLVAYQRSGINYSIKNDEVYITYLDDLAKTDLKVADRIIEIDGMRVIDKNHLLSVISSKKIGDKVTLKVINNKKEYNRSATLIDVDGEPKIGALVTEKFDIVSSKKIKFDFEDSESGPSGGLMLSLTIYSSINKVDITRGRKIAGTGTIDINGDVGSISGVKYKLMGAVKNKADVFLVPKGDNYREAKKVKKEKGYSIDIVPIESFDEALNYLK